MLSPPLPPPFAIPGNPEPDLGAQSRAYSYGPAVRWNIFDAGRVRSTIRAKDALTDEAVGGGWDPSTPIATPTAPTP